MHQFIVILLILNYHLLYCCNNIIVLIIYHINRQQNQVLNIHLFYLLNLLLFGYKCWKGTKRKLVSILTNRLN